MLKPRSTATRELVRLDGMWAFALDSEAGERPWARRLRDVREAPIPASYNDLFVDAAVRDHVGVVWYQSVVRVPRGWNGDKVFLRFDSATHAAEVYVDEQAVAGHVGGYTPFEADITDVVTAGEEFRLTVAVDNRLTGSTIPPGHVETTVQGTERQRYMHDFFNYGGIARSVWLFSAPAERVDDITVVTDLDGTTGIVHYDVTTTPLAAGAAVRVRLHDAEGAIVADAVGRVGALAVTDAEVWGPGRGYLYDLDVQIVREGVVIDSYTLPIGIRTIEVSGDRLLVNGEPVHLRGFGKHEDTPIRGKGHDDAYLVHDLDLMRWLGANSFRTSHYPYAEEVLEYADRRGVLVIDETAAVGLNLAIAAGYLGQTDVQTFGPRGFGDATRDAHAQHLRELIARDKNHPSVIMWSIANEPDSRDPGARAYFEPLVALARELDPTRPLTYANMILASPEKDVIADLFDVLSINRYYGWYQDSGDLAAAEIHLEAELRSWAAAFDKPIIMSEYGADAVAGLHTSLEQLWSEEYQAALLAMYHRVFDRIDAVVGEHVWAFADFQSLPVPQRVDGNKKGVFTRDRRPKAAARVLRERWHD